MFVMLPTFYFLNLCLVSFFLQESRALLVSSFYLNENNIHLSYHSDAVLSCEWRGDSLSCDISKVNFDNKVSDRLTLKIPRASQEHEGKYSCQTEGTGFVPFNNCTFALQRGTFFLINKTELLPDFCKFMDIVIKLCGLHITYFNKTKTAPFSVCFAF